MHVYVSTTCTKKWMRISIEQKKATVVLEYCIPTLSLYRECNNNISNLCIIVIVVLLLKKSSKKALKKAVRFVHLPLNVQEKTKCHRMFVIKELYELHELYEISRRGN